MQQVIYIDVLIVLNILITYLLLLAGARILRAEPSAGRLLLGSCLGGVYSLIILAPDFGAPVSVVIKLILSISIVSATFKPRSLNALARCVISFFSVSFIFAGVMLAVFAIFKPRGMEFKNGSLYMNFSFVSLVATAFVCYFVVFLFNRAAKTLPPENSVYDISIGIFGSEISGKGLLDTGNSLTDGFMDVPVIVARRSFAGPLFPDGMEPYFDGDFDVGKIPKEWNPRIRAIPAVTVGAPALLPSFRPDYVKISGGGPVRSVIVAVCPDSRLSADYDCLLNAGILGWQFSKREELIQK